MRPDKPLPVTATQWRREYLNVTIELSRALLEVQELKKALAQVKANKTSLVSAIEEDE